MFSADDLTSYCAFFLRAALAVIAVAILAALATGFVVGLAAHGAETPAMPAADAPAPPVSPSPATITLDAPKSVPAGSGYFKIHASAAGPVSFDVEAQFADADAIFESEQLNASTLLVGVPASAGVIRVEAAVAVDGKAPVFAKAFIEVVAPKPKDPPAAPAKPVGKLFAVFVVDKSAASAALSLASNPALLKSVEAGGDALTVLDAKSPAIAAQGLGQFVSDAGGPPCLILMDEQGSVHQAVKAPASAADVLSLLAAVHKGK
jgi:hypothetical protein